MKYHIKAKRGFFDTVVDNIFEWREILSAISMAKSAGAKKITIEVIDE